MSTSAATSRSALGMGALAATSRIFGFVRVLVLAAVLGTTFLGNAFQSANSVSNILFELLAAGALSAVLVPTFVDLLDAGDKAGAEEVAGGVLGAALVALGTVAVVGVLAAPWLARLLTLGVPAEVAADQRELVTHLLRFFVPQVVLYAAGTIATAVLYARRRFAVTAAAPIGNTVVMVACLVAFRAAAGPDPGLDLGVGERWLLVLAGTGGVVAFVGCLLAACAASGFRLRPRLPRGDARVIAALRHSGWGVVLHTAAGLLLGAAVVAGSAVEGGVVAYQVAWVFFLAPYAVLAQPIHTAILPELVAEGREDSLDVFGASVRWALERMALFVLPVTAALMALALPAMRVVSFGQAGDDAGLLAAALATLALGLYAYGAFLLLARAFYALGDSRTPGLVALGVAVVGVAVMGAGAVTTEGSARIAVLGLGHSVAYAAGAGTLLLGLRRRIGHPLFPTPVLAMGLVSALVGGALWLAERWVLPIDSGRAALALALAGVGAVGVLATLGGYRALGLPGSLTPRLARPGRPEDLPRGPRVIAARLGLLTLLLGASSLAACGSSDAVAPPPVDRVLIVSMPGVSWSDVRSHDLPNLSALVTESAIGDLSTRIGRRGASTTDAYLSIGAGTRAIAPSIDVAVALDPDETYAGVRTADILERRLGEIPDGVAYLAAGAAIELNAGSAFGGRPGRLGDLLAEAGVFRAVLANADASEGFVSDEPPPDGAYARGAATALMGSDGIVPGGTVGRGLLMEDPLAPFGRRLDPERVLEAFDAVWPVPGPSVVLVEASDLSRASAYGLRSTPSQRSALRDEALADSDALLGDLLAKTDPEHDAVLVLSPVSPSASPELAIAALRTPEGSAGVLRSATTRRDGYVQLADVAPTVLDLLGLAQPEEIEGRAFRISGGGGGDRVARLIEGAEAAEFRDGLMLVVVPLVIGGLAVLLLATLLAGRLRRPTRAALAPLALTALGVVPGTYVAARIEAVRGSTAGYLLAVAVVAALVGAVATVAERRRPGLGALVGVAVIVGLIGVDVVVGAPLQVNAVFGYSVAVAGRFAGLGNLAFALFGAAAVILSALIVDRYGRRSLPVAIGLLAVVVLIEGLPMLGADVGGVLSMVPAFAVTGVLLSGRRVGPRHLGLGVAGGIAGVLLFAFIDVARPEGARTHLARLAEHLVDGRWGPFVDSLTRRLQASFGTAELAAWVLGGFVVVAGVAYTLLASRGIVGPDSPRRDRSQPLHAAALGVAWLAVGGLIANDSSIAVPATMLIVAVPVFVLRRLDAPNRAAVVP